MSEELGFSHARYTTYLKTLKVKQLKHLLNVKQVIIPTPMEKRTLLRLIMENIPTQTDAEDILTNAPAPAATKSKPPQPTTTKDSDDDSDDDTTKTTATATSSTPRANVRSKNINEMTPQEIKYQALMMKNNPSQYRQQTGTNMTDAQIIAQANQLEQMASNPAMRQQAGAMNELINAMNVKQKEIWTKLFTGKYVPTEGEMTTLKPLIKEQKDLLLKVGATMSVASGNVMTPERIELLLAQAADADPKLLVSMFQLAIGLRGWYSWLHSKLGRATVPVLVVLLLVVIYFAVVWTWRIFWWFVSFFWSSNDVPSAEVTHGDIPINQFSGEEEDQFGNFNDNDDEFGGAEDEYGDDDEFD